MRQAETPAELYAVISAIREQQKKHPEGSEAWNDCNLQAEIRLTRIGKMIKKIQKQLLEGDWF